MSKAIVAGIALGAALVGLARPAQASRQMLHPVVVCLPSVEDEQQEPTGFLPELCLLRLSPMFASTSFAVSPQFASIFPSQATKKRWGARFEIKF